MRAYNDDTQSRDEANSVKVNEEAFSLNHFENELLGRICNKGLNDMIFRAEPPNRPTWLEVLETIPGPQ